MINRSLAGCYMRARRAEFLSPANAGRQMVDPGAAASAAEPGGYNDNKKEPHRMVGWHRGLLDVARYLLSS